MSKFTDSLIGENLEVATEYFKSVMASSNMGKDSKTGKRKKSGGSIGFIPFNIGFTMDGLSGIKIYNELVFDTSFLPYGYNTTLDFIVTGIDHKLKNGDWETDVKVTLIPKTDEFSEIITGSISVNAQQESYTPPPPPVGTNIPTVSTGVFTDDDVWIYLSWQQGAGGAAEHYKIIKGTKTSYSLVTKAAIKSNWPGSLVAFNGVTKSDIDTLYTSNPQKLSQAFFDVQKQNYASKTSSAPATIDGPGSNKAGLPFSTLKSAFAAAADPSNGIKYENIVNFAYIENSFQSDSLTTATYQGMFQMDKNNSKYKTVLNKYSDGQGRNSSYIKYGTSNPTGFITDVVALIVSNFKIFKTASGYPS
jgi:hypothetical protein